MNNPTRCRRAACRCAARTLATATAMAALVTALGAGQALAATAPPDERVLEHQGRIQRQAHEQGTADKPSQAGSAQYPRRFFQPEPPIDTGPRLDADQQVAPAPAPRPPNGPDGLVIGLAVAALLLAVVAATTWRIYHRRPRPEPTT